MKNHIIDIDRLLAIYFEDSKQAGLYNFQKNKQYSAKVTMKSETIKESRRQ